MDEIKIEEEKGKNKSLPGEVLDFIKVKKAWWLTPIMVLSIPAWITITFSERVFG